MSHLLFPLALSVALVFIATSALADIIGPARVIDGDTIEIAGERIRFHGIDAPERGQPCIAAGELWGCGQSATTALAEFIGSSPVTCQERDIDRYGRVVATCSVRGENIEAWMVSNGWALAYRKYSHDYIVEESMARATRVGVWQGKFIEPWEWRKGKRLSTTTSSRAASTQPTHVGDVGPAVSPSHLYLSGIVYFSPSSWTIWLNGQKITPDRIPKYLEVVLFGPDWVEVNITTAINLAPITVKLRIYDYYVVTTAAVAASQVVNTESTVVSGLVLPQSVIDGDTIVLQGRKIRLFGIDAPEKSQPCRVQDAAVACGNVARNALIGFVTGVTVRCDRVDVDRYGRDVSQCYADGYDLSAGMVRAGLAVAYRQYSLSYVSEEEDAKRLKRGMWKGEFVMPWDWRS